MKYLIKPPSKKMIAQLQRARAIELSNNEKNICSTDDFKDTLPALYERRLVDIKMVMLSGKEILGVCITESGIALLNKYEDDQKL